MIFYILILLITFVIGIFILTRTTQTSKGDDSLSSPSIDIILKEVRELREDINRKEKALIDLLQELKKIDKE